MPVLSTSLPGSGWCSHDVRMAPIYWLITRFMSHVIPVINTCPICCLQEYHLFVGRYTGHHKHHFAALDCLKPSKPRNHQWVVANALPEFLNSFPHVKIIGSKDSFCYMMSNFVRFRGVACFWRPGWIFQYRRMGFSVEPVLAPGGSSGKRKRIFLRGGTSGNSWAAWHSKGIRRAPSEKLVIYYIDPSALQGGLVDSSNNQGLL